MRSPAFLTGAVLAVASAVAAFPGMGKAMADLEKRQGPPSSSLIGDLAELPDQALTKTGWDIKNILTGSIEGKSQAQKLGLLFPDKDSAECARDKCCIWKYIANDMRGSMTSLFGLGCNDLARGAVRLGFHDAGTWSKGTGRKGGADGSILLADECEKRQDNRGLEKICAQTRVWFNKYKSYGISMADLIQMGANVGAFACTGGPRVRSFVGRKDSSEPSLEGLMPSPLSGADMLIPLFKNKTISAAGLVALVGAHTTSHQRTVDPRQAGRRRTARPAFGTRCSTGRRRGRTSWCPRGCSGSRAT